MGTEWCLGRLWPSGVLRSASIQSTWLHTKDNTARSNGWICGSPGFDRLYRECVQPVLLLLLQRGPVMIRKHPRPPAMIEEKHVKNRNHNRSQRVIQPFYCHYNTHWCRHRPPNPTNPPPPGMLYHSKVLSLLPEKEMMMMPNLSARTISAATTFSSTSTATKATCAFVAGFPWR